MGFGVHNVHIYTGRQELLWSSWTVNGLLLSIGLKLRQTSKSTLHNPCYRTRKRTTTKLKGLLFWLHFILQYVHFQSIYSVLTHKVMSDRLLVI